MPTLTPVTGTRVISHVEDAAALLVGYHLTPLEFNASADGVTDAKVAIDAAIASGSTYLHIEDNYEFVSSGGHDLPANFRIGGKGKITLKSGSNTYLFRAVNAESIVVEDVELDGNKAGQSVAHPVLWLRNCAYSRLHNVTVHDSKGDGIYIENFNASSDADEVRIIGGRVHSCAAHGLHLDFSSTSSPLQYQGIGDCTITGLFLETNGGNGYYQRGGSANLLADVQALSNGGHGFELDSSAAVKCTRNGLINCVGRNNAGSGYYAHGSGGASNRVEGCEFHYNNSSLGSSNNIDIFNEVDPIVIGCYGGDRDFTFRCAYGAQFSSVAGGTIIGNNFQDNTNVRPLVTASVFDQYDNDGIRATFTFPYMTSATGYVDEIIDQTRANIDNEWRGRQQTLRYYRTVADEATLGWDVFGSCSALVLTSAMNLPFGDRVIRGQLKGMASELYYQSPVSAYTANWNYNFIASIAALASGVTLGTYAGLVVTQPAFGGSITNGYGLWVQNLDTGHSTITNAAALKCDGLDQYGRILWNYMDIREHITYSGSPLVANPQVQFYQSGSQVAALDSTSLKIGAGTGFTGSAVEIAYSGTTGAIFAYNRGGTAYRALVIDGLSVAINGTSGGAIGLGGSASSSARVQIAAGDATHAPLLLVSGTLLTSPVDGAVEFDGSNFWITQNGGLRKLLNPLGAKGDIFTRNSTVSAALAVGTDGFVLSADSSTATGLKWIANTGGGWGLSGNVTSPGSKKIGSTDNFDVALIANNSGVATLQAAGGFAVTNTLTVGGGATITGGVTCASFSVASSHVTANSSGLAVNGIALDYATSNISTSGAMGCTGAFSSGANINGVSFSASGTTVIDSSRNAVNLIAITCSSTLTVGGGAAITGGVTCASFNVASSHVTANSSGLSVNGIALDYATSNITTTGSIGAYDIGASHNVTGVLVSGTTVFGNAFQTTGGVFGVSGETVTTSAGTRNVVNGLIVP